MSTHHYVNILKLPYILSKINKDVFVHFALKILKHVFFLLNQFYLRVKINDLINL